MLRQLQNRKALCTSMKTRCRRLSSNYVVPRLRNHSYHSEYGGRRFILSLAAQRRFHSFSRTSWVTTETFNNRVLFVKTFNSDSLWRIAIPLSFLVLVTLWKDFLRYVDTEKEEKVKIKDIKGSLNLNQLPTSVSFAESPRKHPLGEVIKLSDFEKRYGVRLKTGSTDRLGDVVDPEYTVVGLGAYGEVIKGYDKLRGRKVAIKIVDKDAMNSEAMKAEIEALKRARMHPNILEFLDVFECPETNSWYVITELCEGGELFETLIQNGAYSEGTASRLIARIISAIQHIHREGYVHLDVKPENLVFAKPVGKHNTADMQVFDIKLVDFGMAKSLKQGKDERVNSHVGTTAYWAPELLRPFMDSLASNLPHDIPISEIGSDLRSCDMWAIGIITYIILLGCHPFDPKGTSTDQELARRIISGEQPSLEIHGDLVILSDEAKDFIRKLLDPNPSTRMACHQAIHHRWIEKNSNFSEDEKLLPNAATRLREYSELTKAQRAFASAVLLASLASMERKKSNEYRVNARTRQEKDLSLSRIVETTNFLKLAFNVLDSDGSGKVKPKQISDILARISDPHSETGEPSDIKNEGISFEDFLEEIRKTHTLKYNAGDSVYRKGDKPKGLYIVVSGCAQVEYTCEKGTIRPVSQLGPGEIFGELALLDGRDEYNATITCTEPCEVLFWGKEDFVRAVSSSKDLADSISQSINKKQTFRARTLLESIPNLESEQFKKGDIIFHEGDDSDSLYLIRKGTVESYTKREIEDDGDKGFFSVFTSIIGGSSENKLEKAVEDVVVSTNKPGDILGSCAVTGGHYAVTTRCLTDVEVAKITKHELRKLLAQPSLVSNLIRHDKQDKQRRDISRS